MQPTGQTLGDLIDRYTRELYPSLKWGRSKSADLARLKKELGHIALSYLAQLHITESFRKRHGARL